MPFSRREGLSRIARDPFGGKAPGLGGGLFETVPLPFKNTLCAPVGKAFCVFTLTRYLLGSGESHILLGKRIPLEFFFFFNIKTPFQFKRNSIAMNISMYCREQK